tara:strand:- start:7814 stop:8773 length:960 start_codon:yes stop_codon:yes gene_type:complete
MIQIIGAGAIGCLWLAKLQQSGHACHIVSRSKSPLEQLHFTDLQGQLSKLTISHSQQLLSNSYSEQSSTILVCVKAPQVLSALLSQQQHINNQQIIILMHNGYGCAEQVYKHFPDNPIICATTANASLLNNPLNITHTGIGPSYFGLFVAPEKISSKKLTNAVSTPQKNHVNSDISHCIMPLQHAMAEVYWCENIIQKCWLKLMINAVINPLTAIYQIKNGQLQSLQYSTLIQPLILEVFAIAEAELLHFELTSLLETVNNVIAATAENFSSMNRDIFYRRETEIEFINGYLIKKAQQHNIETPILVDLYLQIKALESR